jgi:hypothetical protein
MATTRKEDQMRITTEALSPYSFPVVTVRYSGPTNHRGSRWFATCRRGVDATYRASGPYDYTTSGGSPNALSTAHKCLQKALTEASVDDYVAIPGDLSPDSYAFTFVPKTFFAD